MKRAAVLTAAFALAGCGTIFEEDLNRVTEDVQALKQGEDPFARESAAQGASAPRPVDGQLVRKVQRGLKAEGIDPGPVDGVWGPKTSQAVRRFQQKEGIATSGQLDARTLSALGVAGGQTAAAGGSRQSEPGKD